MSDPLSPFMAQFGVPFHFIMTDPLPGSSGEHGFENELFSSMPFSGFPTHSPLGQLKQRISLMQTLLSDDSPNVGTSTFQDAGIPSLLSRHYSTITSIEVLDDDSTETGPKPRPSPLAICQGPANEPRVLIEDLPSNSIEENTTAEEVDETPTELSPFTIRKSLLTNPPGITIEDLPEEENATEQLDEPSFDSQKLSLNSVRNETPYQGPSLLVPPLEKSFWETTGDFFASIGKFLLMCFTCGYYRSS